MSKRQSPTTEDRLDAIGWGLLFLIIAAVALPAGAAQYLTVAGVGLAILGLNAYRAFEGIEVSWFGIVLGGSCAIAGGAALSGLHTDLFVDFFVLAAVVTIALALRPQQARAG